jgi:hypothetical protein
MRNLAKALHLLSSFAVLACSPKVLPPPAATSSSDSVQIEIREYFIHDSIPYEVPVIIEKNMTRDTTSHLENDWAESDASLVDGFLEHTLKTKGHTVYLPVQVPVHDTLWREKSAQETIITKEVEKPLSWWQQARLRAFWWLLAAVLLLAAWTWRKPLLRILKI